MLHRQEISYAEAVALQLQADNGTPIQQADGTTVALVTKAIKDSKLAQSLALVCAKHGLPLLIQSDRDGYKSAWRKCKNLITWGVKWPSRYYRRRGKNVLYLENGLLCQRSGVYVDHMGYFCDSSISQTPQPAPSFAEVAAMQAHVKRHLGVDWFEGGNDTGPVLVACQTGRDCSVRYHYAPNRKDRSAVLSLIEDAYQYLPAGTSVVVRPHPRERAALDGIALPDGWTIDNIANPIESLRRCRGVVTITSTLATEALSMGLPVACLGRGAWQGSGAVIECAENPANLVHVLDKHPEEWQAIAYLCAVLRHQLPYNATVEDVENNESVQAWLKNAGANTLTMEQKVSKARYTIEQSGNTGAIELLKAINAKAGTCAKCQQSRLNRKILELAESLAK